MQFLTNLEGQLVNNQQNAPISDSKGRIACKRIETSGREQPNVSEAKVPKPPENTEEPARYSKRTEG